MKEPKVYISLTEKNGKIRKLSGLASNVRKRLGGSFIKRAKLGDWKKLEIKVVYGKDKGELVTNHANCEDYSHLKWAIDNFTDKYLWL